MAEQRDPAQEFYWAMRGVAGKPFGRDARRRENNLKRAKSKPFDDGRDPVSAAAGIDSLIEDFNWKANLREAELFENWGSVIGAGNASVSRPIEISGGTLRVRCESTSWATQFRIMHDQILGKLNELFPELGIRQIRFSGPEAPSWKKGSRSVPGRGPRDTYG